VIGRATAPAGVAALDAFGASVETESLARRLSRVLAAVLIGASVGAVAKAHATERTASVAGALGVDWAAVRGAAGAVDVRVVAAWVALVALLAVAAGSAARAVRLWRRDRAADARRGAPTSGAGAPPRVQRTSPATRSPNHSDAPSTGPTHPTDPTARLAAARLTAGRVVRGAVARLRRRRAAARTAAPSEIHALAAAGVSPAEIARRTGLAQDAVTLALSLGR
jgi:hypothetical protein